ncbi:MAG TPA: hypothetical protein PKD00_00585 [Burkholderiales bacterium]|nr:hypothetical protein [Burkholderiales bacterium]
MDLTTLNTLKYTLHKGGSFLVGRDPENLAKVVCGVSLRAAKLLKEGKKDVKIEQGNDKFDYPMVLALGMETFSWDDI